MRRIVLVLFTLIIFIGCEERQLPTPPLQDGTVQLVRARLSSIMGQGKWYRIEVETQGAIDSLRLEIFPSGQNTADALHYLHDDGGAIHANDKDYVAGDGFFSQMIQWNPKSALPQNFKFTFTALRNDQVTGEALSVEIFSGVLIAPVITAVSIPDTLASGFEGTVLFQVTVRDSSGAGDIARVELLGTAPGKASFDTLLYDDATHGDPLPGDGIFSLAISREFGAYKNGLYEIRLKAVDKGGLESAVVQQTLFIINGKPELSSLTAPADAQRPASGLLASLVTVKVQDPQGRGDIKRIWLRAYNPNGTGFNSNPFTMYDNGLPLDINRWSLGYRGDEMAGDGIYSMTIIFDPGQALGNYRLTFEAEDWLGNLSEILEHTVLLHE